MTKLGVLLALAILFGISRIIALIIEKSKVNKEKLNDPNYKENHEKLVAHIVAIIILVLFILGILYLIFMFWISYFQYL